MCDVLAQDQPIRGIAVKPCRHKRPHPLGAAAVEADGHATVAFLFQDFVGPVIPDIDPAGAVVAHGNVAFEVQIFERMIVRVNS